MGVLGGVAGASASCGLAGAVASALASEPALDAGGVLAGVVPREECGEFTMGVLGGLAGAGVTALTGREAVLRGDSSPSNSLLCTGATP